MEKVVPVTGQQHGAIFVSKVEDILVRGVPGKGFTQEHDIVPELIEQVAQIVWHVVVKKELHSEAGAICRATRRSISPR
jgi:hypothetical protein